MDTPNFILFCENFPPYVKKTCDEIKEKLLKDEELSCSDVILLQKYLVYFKAVCEEDN